MRNDQTAARSATFTVAVVGPDGAGKTTVCRELEERLEIPCKYLYMGYNPDMTAATLPTTRLINRLRGWRHARGRRVSAAVNAEYETSDVTHGSAGRRPHSLHRVMRGLYRVGAGFNSCVGLAARVCEEWYRQEYARSFIRNGYVVLFDRHFLTDYWANQNEDRSIGRRIHGYLLELTQMKPDLVIYLDAPADVLYARKREGTVQSLDRQRHGYLSMRDKVPAFQVVDATQALDTVVSSTISKILSHYDQIQRN